MAKNTIYYSDPIHDDFANNQIKTKQIPADYPFVIRNPFWLVLEFIVYRLIATPLVWLIGKVGFGLRIKNRKVIRRMRKTGFYLFGNHTQAMMDAYTPSLCAFPHKAYIVANPDAVSIPGIRRIVQMLGAIPLPSTTHGYQRFIQALSYRTSRKKAVAIYPEAHIWPWYTGIRPFPDSSFAYPVAQGVPAIAFVTTYRKRRLFKNLPPCMTVTLSEPFYPDLSIHPRQAKKQLRDAVYRFMCRTVSDSENYAYYDYVFASKESAKETEASLPTA